MREQRDGRGQDESGPDEGARQGEVEERREWEQDRDWFVAGDAVTRTDGRGDVLAGDNTGDGHQPGRLARQFAMLAHALCDVPAEQGVIGVLGRIVHAAQQMVDGADVVSVTLREDDGRFTTPVETDALATRLDHAQYEAGEGPCVAATTVTGIGVTYSPDLAIDSGWPTYGPTAAAMGVRSVLSTAVLPAGDPPRTAALNYYSFSPHGLDHIDRDTAMIIAAHAAVAIEYTTARTAAELQTAQLRRAVASRDVIGQAKGILMERRGYSADQAFQTLRRASQDLNVKLVDVATTLAERRTEI